MLHDSMNFITFGFPECLKAFLSSVRYCDSQSILLRRGTTDTGVKGLLGGRYDMKS